MEAQDRGRIGNFGPWTVEAMYRGSSGPWKLWTLEALDRLETLDYAVEALDRSD